MLPCLGYSSWHLSLACSVNSFLCIDGRWYCTLGGGFGWGSSTSGVSTSLSALCYLCRKEKKKYASRCIGDPVQD